MNTTNPATSSPRIPQAMVDAIDTAAKLIAIEEAAAAVAEEAANLFRHEASGDDAEYEITHRIFHACVRHLADISGLNRKTITEQALLTAFHNS